MYDTPFNEAPIPMYNSLSISHSGLWHVLWLEPYLIHGKQIWSLLGIFLTAVPRCCQYCSSLMVCAYSMEQVQLKTDVQQQLLSYYSWCAPGLFLARGPIMENLPSGAEGHFWLRTAIMRLEWEGGCFPTLKGKYIWKTFSFYFSVAFFVFFLNHTLCFYLQLSSP